MCCVRAHPDVFGQQVYPLQATVRCGGRQGAQQSMEARQLWEQSNWETLLAHTYAFAGLMLIAASFCDAHPCPSHRYSVSWLSAPEVQF